MSHVIATALAALGVLAIGIAAAVQFGPQNDDNLNKGLSELISVPLSALGALFLLIALVVWVL